MRIIRTVPYRPFIVWEKINYAHVPEGEMGCMITMPGQSPKWHSCEDFSERVYKGFKQMIYVTLN